MEGVTPELAFQKGLVIAKALRTDRVKTKLLLFAELKRLWRAVRVGDDKTWRNDEDVQECVDDIIDLYRTMKVEEVLWVMTQIRRGNVKLYGRLDTPTILEAIGNHDQDVTTRLREAQHQGRQPIIQHFDALKQIADELPKSKPTLEEIFSRGSAIPEEERRAMRERDRQRKSGQAEG